MVVADNGLQLFTPIFIYQLAGEMVFGGLAQMLSIRIFEASPHSWLMLSNVTSKRNISEPVRTDSKGVMKSFMASDWERVFNRRSVCRGYLKISGSLSQGGIVIQAA